MIQKTLKEFADEGGQVRAAQALGMTQSGVARALIHGRKIFVTCKPDGTVFAEEIKPFPRPSKSHSAK